MRILGVLLLLAVATLNVVLAQTPPPQTGLHLGASCRRGIDTCAAPGTCANNLLFGFRCRQTIPVCRLLNHNCYKECLSSIARGRPGWVWTEDDDPTAAANSLENSRSRWNSAYWWDAEFVCKCRVPCITRTLMRSVCPSFSYLVGQRQKLYNTGSGSKTCGAIYGTPLANVSPFVMSIDK
eukprot:Colp12_sorted_trinity150504_noHs@20441